MNNTIHIIDAFTNRYFGKGLVSAIAGTLAFLAAIFGIAGHSLAADSADKMELYACCFGRSPFAESYAFSDGRKDARIEIAWSFYVARVGTQVTLIDTGFSDAALAGRFKFAFDHKPAELLAELHIDPATVSRVIITHLHFDHLNGLPLFPNAQVFMSRRDRDDYLAKKVTGGVVFDQRVADILADPKRTHLIDGKEMIGDGFEMEVVGGHTAGSAVVHVHHNGIHYVMTGDECYLTANQKEQRTIGVTASRQQNAEFLARIADPAIVVLPCHDPAIFTRYKPLAPGIVRIF